MISREMKIFTGRNCSISVYCGDYDELASTSHHGNEVLWETETDIGHPVYLCFFFFLAVRDVFFCTFPLFCSTVHHIFIIFKEALQTLDEDRWNVVFSGVSHRSVIIAR